MTNSSAFSPKLPKLILIHGMNNNQECFFPLRDALKDQGFDVVMVVLPNHGEWREEVKDFKSGLKIFTERLEVHTKEPYHVVAFSKGAMYFQTWLMQGNKPLPLSYVLLAPAVFINFHSLISPFFHILPETFFILSQMPKFFRRYDRLYFWEYRLLLEGVAAFGKGVLPLPPKLVIMDMKDELVDAKKVRKYYESLGTPFYSLVRAGLKRTLGRHHIIFHPEYFQENEWQDFLQTMVMSLKGD